MNLLRADLIQIQNSVRMHGQITGQTGGDRRTVDRLANRAVLVFLSTMPSIYLEKII